MWTPTLKELDHIGTIPPPPGVTPNFDNPVLHGYRTWAIDSSVCIVFSSLFVLMRIYTKFILIKTHGWEDYTSVIAWLGFIIYTAYDVECFAAGAGFNEWDIPLSKIGRLARVENTKEIVNGPVMLFTKLSILLQFRRIFSPHRIGKAYYFIHALIWINLGYYIAADFAIIFICTPRRKLWDVLYPKGKCLDSVKVVIVTACINAASDAFILMIPVFCISALQMPLQKKIGVACVFAMGILACIISIIRCVVSAGMVHQRDLPRGLLVVSYWAGAEIAVGIICGCMPVLPQFLRHFVPLIKTRLNSYRRAKSGAPSNNDVSAAAAPWVDRYNESRRLRGMGLGMTDFSVDTTLRTMPGQREPSVMTVHDEESVMDAEDPKSIPLHRLKSVHEVESVRHPEQVLDRDLVLSVGSPDSVEGPRIDGSDKRGK